MSRDSWDHRYRQGEVGETLPDPLVVDTAANLPPGRCLDVACGLGRHARHLARAGWKVDAVDSSQAAIEKLQDAPGVHAICADLERHEFQFVRGAYDLIIDSQYLQRDLFPAMTDALSGCGLLICILPMRDDAAGLKPMNPAYLVGPRELPLLVPELFVLFYAERRRTPQSRLRAEMVAGRAPDNRK